MKEITGFYEKVTPPVSCICEIFIQKFYNKIEMRQNRVNNYQSHPKFRFSTRLIQKKSVWVWQKTILFNFFLCTPLRRTPFHSSLCSSIFTSKVFGLTLQCINNQMASLETQSGQEKQSNDCSIKILMVHRRSFVT